ncbi:MAG: F0F1 ATP synthase subunit B [Firmicutes bacterium]|nr:F0F1 ATP synthase subunit B [Bacillota bacterium]MBQ3198751.1 F0F1 ATP synthase subunit B [Bacillota bacterium]
MEFHLNEFIFIMINFLVLMVVLYKFGWGPVIGMIDSRQQTIDESLEKAAVARKEAEEMGAKLAAEIADARKQAKAIIDEAQASAESVKAEILEQARASAETMITRAQAEIAKEKADAISEIKGEVADMVVTVAGRLLSENMSDQQHMALVDKYIAEVAAQND